MEPVIPDRKYIDSYISAICEYCANHVKTYSFIDPRECDIFVRFENYRSGNNIPRNRVGATFLWLVDGAGTLMLKLALKYAENELGLEKVLITCDDDNLGSARVIEKNGGVLQDRIQNVIDGKDVIMRRYWIEIMRPR